MQTERSEVCLRTVVRRNSQIITITCRETVQRNINRLGEVLGGFLCLLFSKHVFDSRIALVNLRFLKDFYFDKVIVIILKNT